MSSSRVGLVRRREQGGRGTDAAGRRFLRPRYAVVVNDPHRPSIGREREGIIPVRCEAGVGNLAHLLPADRGAPHPSALAHSSGETTAPANAIKEAPDVKLEIHALGSPPFEYWFIRKIRNERASLPSLDGLC